MQFLDRLDDEARKLLLAMARPVSYARGARLVRHGDTARGAWVLAGGSAEATVLLPGGEKLVVATLGPGDIFGETSLLERSTCTATVTAAEKVDGWFVERDDFRALAAQRTPAALRVQHAVTLVLSAKLRALNARVLAAAGDKSGTDHDFSADPLANAKRLKKASFDPRPFLPLLPLFEGCDEADIEEICAPAKLLELPRGHALFYAGLPSEACFVVLRGAVEVRGRQGRRVWRMAVHGPGQLVGYMSALEHGPHGADALVREDAVLLELPRPAFEALYHGSTAASARVRRAIQRSLLASLAQTNRHLTRLISLARLRGADREGDALEKALGAQIVSSPDRAA